MKYFTVLLALFISILPLSAEEQATSVIMGDFDKTLQGFSLSKGELVAVNIEEEFLIPVEIDFIFDMPHGIGMNNADLAPGFSGTTGIIDIGPVSLMEHVDFPDEEFNISFSPEEIIPGHTYIIRTTDTDYYGKIHIISIDSMSEKLEFTWIYLEK